MAPIRRYLRITKYSVLEVRIYLDNPALADSWLLEPRNPVLPRVIDAVRPLVLPKLREENENAKRKGGKKKKSVRDIVHEDDFEVSIFLTETSTTHSILTKQKSFADKPQLKSNSNKLGDWLNNQDNPLDVEAGEVPRVLLEEDAEETRLQDIPEARNAQNDGIFVHSSDEEDEEVFQTQQPLSKKRKRVSDKSQEVSRAGDDKKKLALSTAYEGFSIYGRILCLIVKRKDGVKRTTATGATSGSQMLENWVSTQVDQQGLGDVEDDG